MQGRLHCQKTKKIKQKFNLAGREPQSLKSFLWENVKSLSGKKKNPLKATVAVNERSGVNTIKSAFENHSLSSVILKRNFKALIPFSSFSFPSHLSRPKCLHVALLLDLLNVFPTKGREEGLSAERQCHLGGGVRLAHRLFCFPVVRLVPLSPARCLQSPPGSPAAEMRI